MIEAFRLLDYVFLYDNINLFYVGDFTPLNISILRA